MGDPIKALNEAIRVTKIGGIIVIYDQITLLDRLLGLDKVVFKRPMKNARLLEFKYLFNKRFYIAKMRKISG